MCRVDVPFPPFSPKVPGSEEVQGLVEKGARIDMMDEAGRSRLSIEKQCDHSLKIDRQKVAGDFFFEI